MAAEIITQVFPTKILDKKITHIISSLLRREYFDSTFAIKSIATKINVQLRTAEKWYYGLNAPSSLHLLLIIKSYPAVLEGLLELIGRTDLLEPSRQKSSDHSARKNLSEKNSATRIYTDKFVSINVSTHSGLARRFNERQFWFLGKIQKGYEIKAKDIADAWGVTMRTAHRDIANLVMFHFIHFVGAKKNGKYEVRW